MAGHIFSVTKSLINGVREENIKKGYFTPFTPAITEELLIIRHIPSFLFPEMPLCLKLSRMQRYGLGITASAPMLSMRRTM